jgi:hypothetical protein
VERFDAVVAVLKLQMRVIIGLFHVKSKRFRFHGKQKEKIRASCRWEPVTLQRLRNLRKTERVAPAVNMVAVAPLLLQLPVTGFIRQLIKRRLIMEAVLKVALKTTTPSLRLPRTAFYSPQPHQAVLSPLPRSIYPKRQCNGGSIKFGAAAAGAPRA